jgi:hypothetical protein
MARRLDRSRDGAGLAVNECSIKDIGLNYTRRHHRYPLTLNIELARGTGLTRNVSAGGVYFVTDQPHTPGAPIEFTLVFEQLSQRAPSHLQCKGSVLRVEPQGDRLGVAATIASYRITAP